MKIKLYFTLLILVLLFSRCEKIKIGQISDCHIGTDYKVARDLSFTINSVTDSRRSPQGLGLLEGNVYADFTLNLKGNIIDTALFLNYTKLPPNYVFGDYEIGVYGVEPIMDGKSSSKEIIIKVFISK